VSYATPTQYLAKYGKDEALQLLADEEQLLTRTLLLDAIAVAAGGAWSGSPTAEEMQAGVDALERLTRALLNASNLMDGYISTVYTLPLTLTPALAGTLEDCCLALTRCALADDSDNATERMDKTCDAKLAWLRDVAARKVQLVVADGTGKEASTGSATARTGQASTGVAWDLFGGVR
jgi:phage gp36-like protein